MTSAWGEAFREPDPRVSARADPRGLPTDANVARRRIDLRRARYAEQREKLT